MKRKPNFRAKTLREIADLSDGKPVAYIAGKVTGLDYAATVIKFMTRQLELEAEGYVVINPMQLVHREATWQDAMKICVSYLPHADVVSLLPDWAESDGAKFEKMICDKLEISVFDNA